MEASGYPDMSMNRYSPERDRREGGKHLLLGVQQTLPGHRYNHQGNMNSNNIMVLNHTGAGAEDASGMQTSAEDAPSYR